MKQDLSLVRFVGVITIVAALSAACAPIPVELPRVPAPTTSVLLPGVEAPGVSTSPLQPAAVITSTVPVLPTTVLTPTAAIPSPTPLPTLVGPVWQWVSSSFKDGTVLAPGDPARYTFQLLGDGNAMIQADCNFGAGSYTESGARLSFRSIGTTKMACPPDSLDSAFLAQLQNAASYALGAEGLVISLKDEAGIMSLQRAPGETVVTTTATLTPFASPTPLPTGTPSPTATASAPPPTQPAALPATPAPLLTATPLPLPLMPSPSSTVVPLPTVVEAGEVNPPLNGTSWLLVSLAVNAQAISPEGSAPITLEIDPNGSRIGGSTGCNEYLATLRPDAGGVRIVAPALMTQQTCRASLMVQEVEFIDSLLRARGYLVNGNELTLMDGTGNAVLVFARK